MRTNISFKAIQTFTSHWEESPAPSEELIFCINTLAAIEQHQFVIITLPCDFFYFLNDYARSLQASRADSSRFKYYVSLIGASKFDASEPVRKLLRWTQAWATELIDRGTSDETELFFCQVFAGQILYPTEYYANNSGLYPELRRFLDAIDQNNQTLLANERKNTKIHSTSGIFAGAWIPSGPIRVLGSHPTIGYLLGGRGKKNEVDLVASMRFLYPTPQYYSVYRFDTVIRTNYYFGGAVSLDYIHYFIRTRHFEIGTIASLDYEEFNFLNASSNGNSDCDIYLQTVDLAGGLRFKYFPKAVKNFGFAAKFHLLNYVNPGGTDLSGNTITLDAVWAMN